MEYDSITVTELTPVFMCYAQGDGLIPHCLGYYDYTVPTVSFGLVLVSVVVVVWCVSSVARSCATREDANKDNVCTPTISAGINRPPHPDHRAYTLELRDHETDGHPAYYGWHCCCCCCCRCGV